MELHSHMTVNDAGHLEIDSVDTVLLAKKYGTPLFVYDTRLIRKRIAEVKDVTRNFGIKAAYASKAFSCMALYRIIKEEGLKLDVVSGGELFTALKSGFPGRDIHFHGNNKSREELEYAVQSDLGCIVVDNFHELTLLKEITERAGKTVDTMIRVAPGVSASTHDYITTGQQDSKFGFELQEGQALLAVQQILNHKYLNLQGVHFHLGSQLFETKAFEKAVKQLYQHFGVWRDRLNYVPRVLNLGGGFGIRYTRDDQPLPLAEFAKSMASAVQSEASKKNLSYPELWIEPGRFIVGEAGTTLYTAGSLKEVPGVCNFVSVDGGMTDNIRPALYQAKYDAILANRVLEADSKSYTISGKCCETSDILIRNAVLPEVNSGDILAVFCTGAYGYAMANNYNRIPRPPVVFVEDGKEQLVIRRETHEDLLRLEQF